MKAIIFDIDGVVIKSGKNKSEIIKNILVKYGLYKLSGVEKILYSGVNRKLLLEEIYKIKKFNKESVLKEINKEMDILESSPIKNNLVIDFINKNKDNYLFFTNTSLPKAGLNRILEALDIKDSFTEEFMYETGTKLENVNHILNKYNLQPNDVLFIDDYISHINNVKPSGVHLLHYTDYNIDIERELHKLK